VVQEAEADKRRAVCVAVEEAEREVKAVQVSNYIILCYSLLNLYKSIEGEG